MISRSAKKVYDRVGMRRRTVISSPVTIASSLLLAACGEPISQTFASATTLPALASATPSATATLSATPGLIPPPPAVRTRPSDAPEVPTVPSPTIVLPLPQNPPAIILTASPDNGAGPLSVTFTVTIPAGVGTICEAWVFNFGDGQGLELYTPCGFPVPATIRGTMPAPFATPTRSPRTVTATTTQLYTYKQTGTYMAQFAVHERPGTPFFLASNIVEIVVN